MIFCSLDRNFLNRMIAYIFSRHSILQLSLGIARLVNNLLIVLFISMLRWYCVTISETNTDDDSSDHMLWGGEGPAVSSHLVTHLQLNISHACLRGLCGPAQVNFWDQLISERGSWPLDKLKVGYIVVWWKKTGLNPASLAYHVMLGFSEHSFSYLKHRGC